MALSSDGSRAAIGSPLPSHVRVFEWDGSAWVQVGTNIDEETPGDFFGWSAALSADGSRVAIGAQFNDDAGEDAGHVRVYSSAGVVLPDSASGRVPDGTDVMTSPMTVELTLGGDLTLSCSARPGEQRSRR